MINCQKIKIQILTKYKRLIKIPTISDLLGVTDGNSVTFVCFAVSFQQSEITICAKVVGGTKM